MSSAKGLFITYSLIGLFAVMFITFASQVQEEHGVSDSIRQNVDLNRTFNQLESNLSTFSETADASKNGTLNQKGLTSSFGQLILDGIFQSASTITNMVTLTYDVVIVQTAGFIGIPDIVITILTAIITILFILAIWRLIRTGT
jgi:hypothetical protein